MSVSHGLSVLALLPEAPLQVELRDVHDDEPPRPFFAAAAAFAAHGAVDASHALSTSCGGEAAAVVGASVDCAEGGTSTETRVSALDSGVVLRWPDALASALCSKEGRGSSAGDIGGRSRSLEAGAGSAVSQGVPTRDSTMAPPPMLVLSDAIAGVKPVSLLVDSAF
jgi:hypothetical protein